MKVAQIFLVVSACAARLSWASGSTSLDAERKRALMESVFEDDYLARFIIDTCDPLTNILIPDTYFCNILEKLYPLNIPTGPGYDIVANMKQCPERRRLSLLFHCFPQLPLSLAFSYHSSLLPNSLATAKYVVDMQCRNLEHGTFNAQKHHDKLADYWIARKEFEYLAYLLRRVPCEYSISYYGGNTNSEAKTHALYTMAKIDATVVMDFLMISRSAPGRHFKRCLSSLLSVQLSDTHLNTLIQACSCDHSFLDTAIDSIGIPCGMDFEKYTAEYCAALYRQNTELIQLGIPRYIEGCVLIVNAFIMNEIRFNIKCTDLDKILVSYPLGNWTIGLLNATGRAAIYANKPNVFQAIWKLSGWVRSSSPELKKAVLQHPEFAKLELNFHISAWRTGSASIRIMYPENSPNRHLMIAEIQIRSLEDLSLIAEFFGKEVLDGVVKTLIVERGADASDMAFVVSKFFKGLDNPIPFVNVILSNFSAQEVSSMFNYELNILYCDAFRSNAGNIREPCMLPVDVKIMPTADFLKTLLDDASLAKHIGSEQARSIRERFNLNLRNLITEVGDLRILRLFSILQIHIRDWSFRAEIDQAQIDSFKEQVECFTYAKLVEAAQEPGFLPRLMLWMCSDKELSSAFERNVKADEYSPLTLHCWELFAMWYHTNPDSFRNSVPAYVREAFTRYAPQPGAIAWVAYAKRYISEGGTCI